MPNLSAANQSKLHSLATNRSATRRREREANGGNHPASSQQEDLRQINTNGASHPQLRSTLFEPFTTPFPNLDLPSMTKNMPTFPEGDDPGQYAQNRTTHFQPEARLGLYPDSGQAERDRQTIARFARGIAQKAEALESKNCELEESNRRRVVLEQDNRHMKSEIQTLDEDNTQLIEENERLVDRCRRLQSDLTVANRPPEDLTKLQRWMEVLQKANKESDQNLWQSKQDIYNLSTRIISMVKLLHASVQRDCPTIEWPKYSVEENDTLSDKVKAAFKTMDTICNTLKDCALIHPLPPDMVPKLTKSDSNSSTNTPAWYRPISEFELNEVSCPPNRRSSDILT